MKGIIYKYTFPDGKVYIGQTRRNPEIRKREHLDKLVGPTNTGFWEAYKKYGEPQYDIIYEVECDNVDRLVSELNIMETYFIQQYRASNPEFGYNINSYGHVVTDANGLLRKKYDELFKLHISSRMQVYNSLEQKLSHRKANLTDDELFLVKEKYRDKNPFQGIVDEFNFESPTRNTAFNREMFYDDVLPFIESMIIEDLDNEIQQYLYSNLSKILYEARKENAILQIDKEGNVVKEYLNTNEICQAFHVTKAQNVLNVLKGKQKTAYGFYWKYAREVDNNADDSK